MHFVAMCLQLKPQTQPTELKHADGVYLQAALYHLITRENAAAGAVLHDTQRHKPYTLAILDQDTSSPKVRLTWLGTQGLHYANLFNTAIAKRPSLVIGQTSWDVSSVDLRNSEWSGISTWSDMYVPDVGRNMRFMFATPTAITKRDADGRRFNSVFPDPSDLFAGLRRRWETLEGPALPDDLEQFVHSGGCVVANHEMHTVEFRTAQHTQIGFVGRVVYHCRKSSLHHIAALNALTRFAFFSGVGYQTARGMGTVKAMVEP